MKNLKDPIYDVNSYEPGEELVVVGEDGTKTYMVVEGYETQNYAVDTKTYKLHTDCLFLYDAEIILKVVNEGDLG